MSDFMELKLELGTGVKLESAPEPEPAAKPILCKFSALHFLKKILKIFMVYTLYLSRGFFNKLQPVGNC